MRGARRRRVVLATRIFAPEAAAATFRLGALVRALAGHAEVRVLTTMAPPHLRGPQTQDDGPVRVSRWPVLRDATGYVRGYLPYLSFDLPLALRLLTGPRPDVVVVEPPPTTGAVTRTALALRALPGRLAGHPRIPYVYYAADVWSDATASMGAPAIVVAAMRAVESYALRGARDVIAVSDGVADRVRSLLGGTTRVGVSVVPNGIDTDVFTSDGERHPQAPETPYLVYAGTASEWQGAEVFAEAMREVVAAEPTARLVFLGQGSSWPLLQRLRAELPDGAIELRPLVPPAEAAAWLRGAAVALVSVRPGVGYDFAYPTKVIAALATGAPVVFAGPGPAAADVRAYGLGDAVDHDVPAVAAAMLAAVRSAAPGAGRWSLRERERRVAWVRQHRSLSATGEAAAAVVLDAAAEPGSPLPKLPEVVHRPRPLAHG
ncbi:glycosyltransferase [Ornithinimicrobium pratense]|uniref:D-inositol 3-phosphate glycosyltransferase n=1 Tax=Ornithinimicrobium pratense TaxID=2593973 RepID=A0A5J6V5R3_9MICO|nr:glycosyltransferase [Ornithinimicrobium pratense]QFG68352.1 glycosyltransferase family 4 protein [Ornithinimicrobium pratense]